MPGKKLKRTRLSREATLLIAEIRTLGSTAVLVERRPAPGLWGGLWSPPQFKNEREALAWYRREFVDAAPDPQVLAPIDHAFTHFDLRLNPLLVRCELNSSVQDSADRLWYPLETPLRIGLPQPINRLFERLRTRSSA